MRQPYLRARAFGLVAALAAALALAACDEDGPAEEAGENLDNATEDAGDKVEDATDN